MSSFTSGDGWLKLPSGHTFQYGSVGVSNPNAGAFSHTANFKIPFASEVYGVLVISQTTASAIGLNPIYVVTAKTLTDFTVRADLNDVTSGSKFSIDQSYFYIALGK
ncbi:gp53-like domain-containing protein [Citrobacter freundii]|uniref:gp53-like domain-containing protein n=1 Tax=Citrobacter freundii TaxID=546 RepID=UPI004043822B